MSTRIEDQFSSPERLAGIVAAVRETRAAAATTRFSGPRKVPGQRTGCLSPLEMLALTRVTRPEVEFESSDMWLSERPLETVHSKGIMFGAQWFWSLDLARYVTGDKRGPRRKLAIRYDRSLYARGVLRKVILVEYDAQDRLVARVECPLRDECLAELSELNRERLLKKRAQHVNVLKAKIAESEQLFLALEAGTEQLEVLLRDADARRQRQRKQRHDPIVAAPIVFGREEEQDPDRLALRTQLEPSRGSVEPRGSNRVMRTTGAAAQDDYEAADTVPSYPVPTPTEDSFGELLGGSTGIDVGD
jgi:hypothetical protein